MEPDTGEEEKAMSLTLRITIWGSREALRREWKVKNTWLKLSSLS